VLLVDIKAGSGLIIYWHAICFIDSSLFVKCI
jgi:hypothetical protein